MTTPWAQIRGAGGPQPDKQCPEAYRRADVNVYDDDQLRGEMISQQIDNALRTQPHGVVAVPGTTFETDVISIDGEGGPFELVDTDRRVPFVFRSYVMFYGEDLDGSPVNTLSAISSAWLAPKDTARPDAPNIDPAAAWVIDGHWH